jgi:hypothetical protein
MSRIVESSDICSAEEHKKVNKGFATKVIRTTSTYNTVDLCSPDLQFRVFSR